MKYTKHVNQADDGDGGVKESDSDLEGDEDVVGSGADSSMRAVEMGTLGGDNHGSGSPAGAAAVIRPAADTARHSPASDEPVHESRDDAAFEEAEDHVLLPQ